MKAFALVSLLFAVGTNAHTIFQKLRVNGADQGQLVGVRAPSTNNPVTDVSSSAITCNTGLISPVSTAVVTIPAGASVGAWWQHIIGGPQGTNDADNPIAKSHKGPVQVYLAKVDNAGTAGTTGLKWFKIYSYGLQGGVWGVDAMINNNGWSDFTIPSCIAPGNYLMRVEIIALHNAYTAGGAQFYMSCANINITGSGTYSPTSTVSFPGVYSSSDPGITLNIYDSSGQPTNGGKSYTPPGPAVISCSDAPPASSSTNQGSTTRTSSSSTSSTRTSTASGSGQTLYGQCGGQGWTGPTTCASGTCKVSSQYYSQCLP